MTITEKGMVLMTVLWIVLVISFISFALAAAVRVELNSAGNSLDAERALFMARGGAEAAFLKISDPKTSAQPPKPDVKNVYTFQLDSGQVRVDAQTDSSRIDLNGADEKVLGSMFDSMGVDAATRDALVDSILDWRDPDDVARPNGAEIDNYVQPFGKEKRLPANAPFNTLQEAMLVKHMTPDIYFGRISFDPKANKHEKVMGLRDLATAGSGGKFIDVNTAPVEVLAALPGMSRDLAGNVVTEREKKPFVDLNDCFGRIPDLANSPAHDYLTTLAGLPNVLVSTATVQPSGSSKTVRLRLRTERVRKIITYEPLVYIDTPVLKFGAWEY